MTNKHLSQAPSNLVKAKLNVLLDSVNDMYRSGNMVTEADLSSIYHSALDTFFKSLDGSISNSTSQFLSGQPADPLQYNIFTNALSRDLEALFAEIGALDKIVTSSFNSITATREQILQRSKRISNKLGDYLLYADQSLGAGYFFGDSFNSAERIEIGSSLVKTDECFLGQEEGVILLPEDGSPDRPNIKSYIINQISNGTLGNNAEADVIGKEDLNALGDNEPNTWMEYEKITAYESNTPLLLDLTITLKEISVINHIHINPINFGTATPVRILFLETSKDGIEYRSVKDEVPIKDFVAEEENNDFDLSPATSKYAGQGFYSFLPRKAQYIHIVLEQHTPYSVQTSNGLRLRYAIGLRDINILGRKFKSEGSIVSTPFSTEQEIRKVALWASENPIEQSLLADISHSITNDDGGTWYNIQPASRDYFEVQEVINFNNISSNSIITSFPVNTLRHKIDMKRNIDAFEGNVTISEDKISKTDIVNMPTGSSPEVSLTEEPIENTVKALLPFWGSYSCPRPRIGNLVAGQSYMMDLDKVDFNVDLPPVDTLRFSLPYNNFANLREHIRVFINSEQWEFVNKDETYLDSPTNTSYDTTAIDDNSKVYYLNKGGAELQFGFIDSNGDRRGLLPPVGAKVSVMLDGDNPQLELTDQGYVLSLSASSDGFKENCNITYLKNTSVEEAKDYQIEMPRGKRATKVPSMSSFAAGSKSATEARTAVYEKGRNNVRSAAEAQRKADVKAGKRSKNKTQNGQQDIVNRKVEAVKSANEAKNLITINSSDSNKKAVENRRRLKELLYINEIEIASEGDSGLLPPIFMPYLDSDIVPTISIEEFDSDGDIDHTKNWTPVEFIDGEQELKIFNGNNWVYDLDRFSFDHETGTVHIGTDTSKTNKTIFKCKKLDATILTEDDWEFYKDPIYGRIDTSRILLSPESVVSLNRSVAIPIGEKDVDLVTDNTKGHNWFNQRILKGTVKLDSSIFPEDTLAVEVPFIDGASELTNFVTVSNEIIDFGVAISDIYTFYLQNINIDHSLVGSPGFGAIREESSTSAPVNIFKTKVTGTPLNDGEWSHIEGIILVKWSGTVGPHTATYKYEENDPGVDVAGLYSIDYLNGVLHLSGPAVNNGNIDYQVSIYSAFYNIAEVVDESDIEKISIEDKSITFSTAFGMRFLKLNTASSARPPFMKLVYSYYEKTEESIKDLEPYFSPICKDLAFRAVTADILEEL